MMTASEPPARTGRRRGDFHLDAALFLVAPFGHIRFGHDRFLDAPGFSGDTGVMMGIWSMASACFSAASFTRSSVEATYS